MLKEVIFSSGVPAVNYQYKGNYDLGGGVSFSNSKLGTPGE